MLKQSLGFMMAATLLVFSGSFAKADTYQVESDWSFLGATYDGDGMFDWNGSTFSNISFNFTETDIFNPGLVWSATNAHLNSNGTQLVLGDNGNNQVSISLSGELTTGSAQTLTGGFGSLSSNPLAFLDDATVQDTSRGSLPEPSAISVLATVSGILGFVVFRRRKPVQ